MPSSTLPVPRQWTKHIRSAFIHTISLASATFTSTCALASKRKASLTRMKSELAQAYQEIALLREEIQIKDDRFGRRIDMFLDCPIQIIDGLNLENKNYISVAKNVYKNFWNTQLPNKTQEKEH